MTLQMQWAVLVPLRVCVRECACVSTCLSIRVLFAIRFISKNVCVCVRVCVYLCAYRIRASIVVQQNIFVISYVYISHVNILMIQQSTSKICSLYICRVAEYIRHIIHVYQSCKYINDTVEYLYYIYIYSSYSRIYSSYHIYILVMQIY